MTRARPNRRKPPKRELPKLPSIPRPEINWRAWSASLAVLAVLAVSLALARELFELPVKQIEVRGNLQRVTKLEITAAAEAELEPGMLALDLDAIGRRIAEIDWVDSVTVQRVWPDTLRVTYIEHQAAARWGDDGLLNTRGELFAEGVQREHRDLPRLSGPPGSHDRVAARYLEVWDRLLKANLVLESIVMDARGAFSIELAGGLRINLGREHIEERIDRLFVVAVPTLASKLDQVAYIDLRYANGFAVGWRNRELTESTLARLGNSG